MLFFEHHLRFEVHNNTKAMAATPNAMDFLPQMQ